MFASLRLETVVEAIWEIWWVDSFLLFLFFKVLHHSPFPSHLAQAY